jgi:hypothetical protein
VVSSASKTIVRSWLHRGPAATITATAKYKHD